VAEIGNDRTKENKIEELKSDEIFYRNEATRLDGECIVWRKRIRDLTAKVHRVERERDWLLDNLRKHKRKYNHLKKGINKLNRATADNVDDDETAFSSDSQLSFEINRGNNALNKKSFSQGDRNSNKKPTSRGGKAATATDVPSSSSSKSSVSGGISDRQRLQTPFETMNYDGFYDVSQMLIQEQDGKYLDEDDNNEFVLPGEYDIADDSYNFQNNLNRFNSAPQLGYGKQRGSNGDERARTAGGTLIRKKSKVLNSLVKSRMVIDGMKELVNDALSSTLSGAWSKFTHTERSPQEVLENCERVQYELSQKKIGAKRVPSSIVAELAALPEVYQIILSMIGAKPNESVQILESASPIRIDRAIVDLDQHAPNNDYDHNNEDSFIHEGYDNRDSFNRDDSDIEGFFLVT